MLLAQLPVEPAHLFAFLGSLAALLAILNQGAKFMDRFKEQPRPDETYVRKEQCRDMSQAQDRRLDRVSQDIADLRAMIERQQAFVQQRMDSLPGQVFAMLRNSGAIGHDRP